MYYYYYYYYKILANMSFRRQVTATALRRHRAERYSACCTHWPEFRWIWWCFSRSGNVSTSSSLLFSNISRSAFVSNPQRSPLLGFMEFCLV